MTAIRDEHSDPSELREAIQQLLGKAIRIVRKREGRLMRVEDESKIHEALRAIDAMCDAYREALFERVHSARVKQITADFQALTALLTTLDLQMPTTEAQANVRYRVKAWHYESRRWVAELPMQEVVRRLPEKDGLAGAVRIERLKTCWLEAGGASFTPPPRRPGAMADGVPGYFQIASLSLPGDWCMDPMDTAVPETGQSRWVCRPVAVLELLDWAMDALLLEVGGSDRGGRTTFYQRRRRASLRDALAFSCIVVFEGVVGMKSARQSQSRLLRANPTVFEKFVGMVHALAVGGKGPKEWALGPDPIRKAIATQRAWQRVFKCAGVRDGEAFDALQEGAQRAAIAMLKPRDRRLLIPAAPPWV